MTARHRVPFSLKAAVNNSEKSAPFSAYLTVEKNEKQKLIYFQSPVGKGLIGKNKNDLVEIKTPAGVKNFEIKDVKYI